MMKLLICIAFLAQLLEIIAVIWSHQCDRKRHWLVKSSYMYPKTGTNPSGVMVSLINIRPRMRAITPCFELCRYLVAGGTCRTNCTHEARHSWGISMCLGSTTGSKCCIPLTHPYIRDLATNSATNEATQPETTNRDNDSQADTMHQDTTEPIQDQSCGISRRNSRMRRVIGGSRAPRGAWPWMVALRSFTSAYLCGGVLISDKLILTAAHCFQGLHENPQFVRAYVGSQTLSYGNEGRERSMQVARIIKHEQFQQWAQVNPDDSVASRNSTHRRPIHDIALVELSQPLSSFSSSLRPVCLPQQSDTPFNFDLLQDIETSEECWVSGWGETEDDTDSVHLQEVRGQTLGHRDCGQQWQTVLTDDVLCFGDNRHGPCQGDSGGQLSCRKDGKFYVVGIVSWGREDCRHDGYPSVFTRIYSYVDWIQQHMS